MQEIKLSRDCSVKYWTYHPEKRPTIVMIHGFTGSHEGFGYIIPQLENFRVIAPDLPGFGVSTITRQNWSIDAIARLLNQFVEQLNLPEPPYILGHSMGGLVVASMLAQNPELYHHQATLISPVPTAIRRNESRKLGAVLGAWQYSIGHRFPVLGPRLVQSKPISRLVTEMIMTTSDAELQRKIRAHHYKNLEYISSIAFYAHLHRDINHRGAIDYANQLKKFEILLIIGDNDSVTPIREQQKFIDAIEPVKVVVLPGVGHLAHYERPNEIAAAIREFFR